MSRPPSPLARWNVMDAASAAVPPDVARTTPLTENTYIVGDDQDIRPFLAALPEQGSGYRRLVRFDGRGLPDLLAYSELFGHTQGSFNGAYREKPGLVWRAHKGLLVIEHFDELSTRLQLAICEFVDTRDVRPFGAPAPIGRVDLTLVVTGRSKGLLPAEASAEHSAGADASSTPVEAPPAWAPEVTWPAFEFFVPGDRHQGDPVPDRAAPYIPARLDNPTPDRSSDQAVHRSTRSCSTCAHCGLSRSAHRRIERLGFLSHPFARLAQSPSAAA